MRRISLFVVHLFLAVSLFSQKDYHAFIPANYDTLDGGVATGDLNRDGIDDLALAIYPSWENDSDWMSKAAVDSLPQRMLIILLGAKDGFVQSAKSSNVVMCKDCGGVFGDPFAGISIARNILQINHYGGSSWRWSYNHKFRYQNGEFYLIGKTTNSYWDVRNCDKLNDFAGTSYEDINYLTGQYARKKISEDCKLLENKKGKGKIEPLISLTKFKLDN